MPTLDFKCNICNNRFEELVLFGHTDNLRCPRCGSAELTRVYEGHWQVASAVGGGCSGDCAHCKGCSHTHGG